ncbi:MAG: hypothetical protein NDF54_08010 [archaeon GB-1867-035]|nr:hypothetical protein [Candidatus Culexmicrobium profundum]
MNIPYIAGLLLLDVGSSISIVDDASYASSCGVFTLEEFIDGPVRDFLNNVSLSNTGQMFLGDFDVGPNIVNLYSQMLADRWILYAGEHMINYALYNRPSLQYSRQTALSLPQPYRDQVLEYKWFSGDVSGVVGEALHLFFLENEIGISSRDVVHLRPAKFKLENRWITCDFSIYPSRQLNTPLANHFQLRISNFILSEAKGLVKSNDLWKRARKAVEQIVDSLSVSFIVSRLRRLPSRTLVGVVTLAIRDFASKSYRLVALLMIR